MNLFPQIKNATFSMKKVTFDYSHENKEKGQETKTRVTVEAEDIIAFFAGVIAVMIVVAMIAGWVPINKLTVGLASFSGAGVVIAKIMQARAAKHDGKTHHAAHDDHHAGHKNKS